MFRRLSAPPRSGNRLANGNPKYMRSSPTAVLIRRLLQIVRCGASSASVMMLALLCRRRSLSFLQGRGVWVGFASGTATLSTWLRR